MEKKKRFLLLALALVVAISCLVVSILYPGILFSHTIYIVFAHFVACIIVDSIVLAVLLCILRKFSIIVSLKFLLYLPVAAAGGSFIGLLLFAVYQLLMERTCVSYEHRWAYIFVEFGLFSAFNFVLSKIILNVKILEACLIGIIIGLINAFIGIAPFSY